MLTLIAGACLVFAGSITNPPLAIIFVIVGLVFIVWSVPDRI